MASHRRAITGPITQGESGIAFTRSWMYWAVMLPSAGEQKRGSLFSGPQGPRLRSDERELRSTASLHEVAECLASLARPSLLVSSFQYGQSIARWNPLK